jgi:NitT/TauT family transport system substrate-binding protein
MMTCIGKYIVFALLSMLIVLQAGPSSGQSRQTSKPVSLKLVIFPFLSFAPIYIAEEEGYFAEQGLQIEYIKMKEAVAFQALARGDVDAWGGLTAVGALNAIQRGANIRFVAARGEYDPDGCFYLGLVARKALIDAGKLSTPAQLKGRNIAWYKTSSEEYFQDKVLKKGDLTLDDVTKISIPPPADLGAMTKGSLDATVAGEPWVSRMHKAGVGTAWIPIQDYLPGFQNGTVMYGPNLLEKNPDAGIRLMVAYLKGLRQYNQGKTARNLEIIANFTKLDKELLKKACWAYVPVDGRIKFRSLDEFQNWAVTKGYLDRPLTKDLLWEPSFVEEAHIMLNKTP